MLHLKKCLDLRNVVTTCKYIKVMGKKVSKNVNYQHAAINLHVLHLNGNTKMCTSVKPGVGLILANFRQYI